VVRFEVQMTLVSSFVRCKPDEIIRGTASEVVYAKLCDQVTQPKFRPRNSA
jgi:hypothetical protein